MDIQKELIINKAFCKGCGICAAFCPKNALKIENGKAERNPEGQCIFCGQCEWRCPDYAIYIEETEGEANQWVRSY